MRWKTKVESLPHYGDERTRKAFAIIPQVLDDGTTIWLEPFKVDEVFTAIPDMRIFANGYRSMWVTERIYVDGSKG